MAKRIFFPFEFFVLQHVDGKFFNVLITRDYFVGTNIAKAYILSNPALSRDDVPVIMDHKCNFLYYHPHQRVWYKNLTDVQISKIFHWLVPSTPSSVLGYTSNVVGP